MSLTCQQLLQKHNQVWHQATIHPFLEQCKLATIKPEQFNTWLVQDYLFVLEFTRLIGRVVAAAPAAHFDILLSGATAIKDELAWFREKARERSLNLNVQKQPTCQRYCHFMQTLWDTPYAVQATVFWAIELAYNQGWQLPGQMSEPYNEFAQRWGNPGFTEYVSLLEKQADQALEDETQSIQEQAESSFLQVAQLESEFWQMAFNSVTNVGL